VSKKRIEEAKAEACVRCGYSRQAHELANFADGPMVGRPVLICPFATFKSPADVEKLPVGRPKG
jgi:hypothetical protein